VTATRLSTRREDSRSFCYNLFYFFFGRYSGMGWFLMYAPTHFGVIATIGTRYCLPNPCERPIVQDSRRLVAKE